jgi:hypothetical protein
MALTNDVLNNHLKCFDEGDLNGILSDYAPGAVMFTPDGPLRGADAMRPLFQAMIAEFKKPGASFTMKKQCVEGDYAYIVWTAETADNIYELATDTSWCGTARSWPSHLPARSRPSARARLHSETELRSVFGMKITLCALKRDVSQNRQADRLTIPPNVLARADRVIK